MGDKHGLDVGNNGDSARDGNDVNGRIDDSDDKDGNNDIDVRFAANADTYGRGANMGVNDGAEVVNNGDGDSDRDGNSVNGDDKNSRIDDGDNKEDGKSDHIDNKDGNSDVGDDLICEINDVDNCRSGVGHGGEEMRATRRDGGTWMVELMLIVFASTVITGPMAMPRGTR